MCKYCKSIRDDGDEEDYHLHLVTPQIRALTLTHAHTNTHTHTHIEDTRTDVSNYVEQSCKQILPVMRAANKNKYLHSIWRSLSPSLSLLAKGKLCVKSVGIFVNLKQQEPKPKPNPKPNQSRVKQSEASARQNRLPTD